MRPARGMAVLSVAVLLFTGCSSDRSLPTDEGTLLAPSTGTPSTQDFDPDQLEYEEFSGTLMGGQGAASMARGGGKA